jgi:hypothetical protein
MGAPVGRATDHVDRKMRVHDEVGGSLTLVENVLQHVVNIVGSPAIQQA